MLEASAIIVVLVLVYVGLVKRQATKTTKLEGKLADEKRANEILTKSVTRPPDRVRELDDAGFRD